MRRHVCRKRSASRTSRKSSAVRMQVSGTLASSTEGPQRSMAPCTVLIWSARGNWFYRVLGVSTPLTLGSLWGRRADMRNVNAFLDSRC